MNSMLGINGREEQKYNGGQITKDSECQARQSVLYSIGNR